MTDNTIHSAFSIKQTKTGAKKGIILVLIGLIIFIAAYTYGYFQLAKINLLLAQEVKTLQKEMITYQNNLENITLNIHQLKDSLAQSKALSEEQSRLIAEWHAAQSGDMNKWYLAEAYYLVKLANDHMQFTQNAGMTTLLLSRADQIIKKINHLDVSALQQSLNADITTLQSLPDIAIEKLYVQLASLNKQIDNLPLPIYPLKAEENAEKLAKSQTNHLSWWQSGLQTSWEGLQKIVIVKRGNQDKLPLVMPQEKIYLYQNLHAQLESALWAILHRENAVYQISLNRAITWIKQYFDQEAAITKSILQELEALQTVNLEPSMVDFSKTLQLFDLMNTKTTSSMPITSAQ